MAHQVAKRAERDLKSIAYYIATESGSIEIAERRIDAIIERFELLADHPDIGRARDDLGAGRRTFPVENYVINHHIAEAVRRYLTEESRPVAKIRKGLAEAGAGSGHDQDDVELEMRRIVAEARSRLGNIGYEPDGAYRGPHWVRRARAG